MLFGLLGDLADPRLIIIFLGLLCAIWLFGVSIKMEKQWFEVIFKMLCLLLHA